MADQGPIANSLEEVVERYLAEYSHHEDRELEWFRRQPTLSEAVRLAGLAERPFGKRFNHQRRIPPSVLLNAARVLLDEVNKIAQAGTFDELFQLIARAIGDIRGVGELMIYDTALRIGAKLSLSPERIYLHSGTREGARYLGFDGKRKSIDLHELPTALQRLEPSQIEDVLCIYKNHLRLIGGEKPASV